MINKKKFHILIIRIFFISFVLLILITSIIIAIFDAQEESLKHQFFPNVYVKNINFGKKDRQKMLNYFNNKNKRLNKNYLTVFHDKTPIATLSGKQLGLKYDSKGIMERAYLIGRSSNIYTRIYQIGSSFFNWQKYEIKANIEYDNIIISEFINNKEEDYNKPAKNALFLFENNRVIDFRKEESGSIIEKDVFLLEFKQYISSLEKNPQDKTIVLKEKVIKPEITLSQSNTYGIEEFIGEGISDSSHSIAGRIHNIILGTSKLNGVLIPKGEIFSFNNTIGDISELTGYKSAYIIKDGKTVLGDGGGVCQISTTMYRAALNSGLEIIERHPHAYRVSYYEADSKPGLDATVFSPSTDLKFKNNTPASILIQTHVDQKNNLLYFRLYGKSDGRKVEISPIQVFGIQAPPPPVYQDDATLKKGITKQIDFAAWGAKSTYNYKVTKNNEVIFEKAFFSSYKPWAAVFLVGTAE